MRTRWRARSAFGKASIVSSIRGIHFGEQGDDQRSSDSFHGLQMVSFPTFRALLWRGKHSPLDNIVPSNYKRVHSGQTAISGFSLVS